ncbi:MAG: type II toxin-antitoxin system RelB/DinJ family antitoxin [Bacteroidales bacterium]|nr:type II toxin-antitoxin system RelB/DinJ family antitoxin [Bacteroidales bacterium]
MKGQLPIPESLRPRIKGVEKLLEIMGPEYDFHDSEVDQTLKQNFDSLCDDFGISTTAAFNIFMKTVVRERRIPFEIKSESEAQKRQKALDAFAAMRAEVAASGMKEMSLEEINAEIKEARNARHN